MNDTRAWSPNFHITPPVANALMAIAEASAAVEALSWSPLVEEEIRWKARLRSTHYLGMRYRNFIGTTSALYRNR